MIVRVTELSACQDCTDIVVQGYCDSIEDEEVHAARVNHIDKNILPPGHYWMEQIRTIEPDHFLKCECCGQVGVDRFVRYAEHRKT